MRRLIERGVFRARRGSPNDDKHDHRAGAHGHARGAAGERAPQPSRPWRHDWDDPRSGHQLQQRPGAAQPGDDQSSQSRVDRRAELAPHHASVRRAKLHAPELQSLAHMSGVKSPDAPTIPDDYARKPDDGWREVPNQRKIGWHAPRGGIAWRSSSSLGSRGDRRSDRTPSSAAARLLGATSDLLLCPVLGRNCPTDGFGPSPRGSSDTRARRRPSRRCLASARSVFARFLLPLTGAGLRRLSQMNLRVDAAELLDNEVLFVTVSMRGRQRRGLKRSDQTRRDLAEAHERAARAERDRDIAQEQASQRSDPDR